VIKNSDYADKQIARNSLLSHTFHSTVGRSPPGETQVGNLFRPV